MGLVNVVPPSEEKTICSLGAFPAPVYQAIATRSPLAAAAAALVGHAFSFQLSG